MYRLLPLLLPPAPRETASAACAGRTDFAVSLAVVIVVVVVVVVVVAVVVVAVVISSGSRSR